MGFGLVDHIGDEQRCLPIMWEVVKELVQGKKLPNKVYHAAETGRKVALDHLHKDPLMLMDGFLRIWAMHTVKGIADVSDGIPSYNLPEADTVRIFAKLMD